MTRILLKVVAGSRLYGTANENSDMDFKEIYVPSKRDILLGKGEDASHVKGDEDTVSWSFQKWIRLLLKMDSNAYEILFAKDFVHVKPFFLEYITDAKKILVDKRDPAIGFINSSITRYALRGERLADFIKTVEILSKYKNISDSLDELYTINSMKLYKDPMGVQMISLHGKSYPVPGPVNDAIKMFNKYVTNSSKRAQGAIDSHDWKGIAHGYRIAVQMLELVRTGNVQFPLKKVDTVRKMRYGEIDIESAVLMVEDKVQELREEPESSYLLPLNAENEAYEFGMDLVYKLHDHHVKQS